MDNKAWFKQAGFGMMVHWGLYALPAGEWQGQRMPTIGEWVQSYFTRFLPFPAGRCSCPIALEAGVSDCDRCCDRAQEAVVFRPLG